MIPNLEYHTPKGHVVPVNRRMPISSRADVAWILEDLRSEIAYQNHRYGFEHDQALSEDDWLRILETERDKANDASFRGDMGELELRLVTQAATLVQMIFHLRGHRARP